MRASRNWNRWSAPFCVLSIFLLLAFLAGGSARSDVQSLIVLRPVAVLVSAYGLLLLRAQHVNEHKALFMLVFTLFALAGLHLIPLPPEIWQQLPGRGIVSAIDGAVDGNHHWRPISMAPSETWNALYSLFIPLAVLTLGVQLSREERFQALYVVLGLLLISAIVGFVQAVGPNDGPLYLYRITNTWASVGLFANRNHQALAIAWCFPMIAVAASVGARSVEQVRNRRILAVSVGAILIPLLLVTGSRAGAILGLLGLLLVPSHIMHMQQLIPAKRRATKSNPSLIYAGVGVVAIGLLSVVFARAEAIQRIINADLSEEVRLGVWETSFKLAKEFFPIGTGVGTFVPVYKYGENYENLNYFYINHAHNEIAEIFLTGGLPAVLALLFFVAMLTRAAWTWFRQLRIGSRDVAFGRLGVSILFMASLSSVVDYPLRVPSIMCVATLAALWVSGSASKKHGSSGGVRIAGRS